MSKNLLLTRGHLNPDRNNGQSATALSFVMSTNHSDCKRRCFTGSLCYRLWNYFLSNLLGFVTGCVVPLAFTMDGLSELPDRWSAEGWLPLQTAQEAFLRHSERRWPSWRHLKTAYASTKKPTYPCVWFSGTFYSQPMNEGISKKYTETEKMKQQPCMAW